ncbi:type II toxin-antitoxin system PemK/MazF family toxin [Rhizobium bangladeshense]|uniref:type II toxin-antitoxin system PemK/MazF family toxin n=1 Tax=Rhizobium bangladeshense TaxID=1138189 RepID=UPI001C8315FF|nr:type II toxin-antitoxin system PemK/MazF family toxin [Rhizobium bangladeshense]MBX4895424.1 type II toxin-antitoxin system PemK/MazF family toxin [Rhizobium bangladeshense]
MTLQFPPKPGTIVICDYQTGFKEPEMVKERLAVVMSPRLPHRDNLCTVVPLSSTVPSHHTLYQVRIELPMEAPHPYQGKFKWAKADMMATVGYGRLSLPYTGRDRTSGKRKYLQIILVEEEMAKVRASLLFALGLGHLTKHL